MITINSAKKSALGFSLAIAITSVLSGCGGSSAETETVPTLPENVVVDTENTFNPISPNWKMVWNDEFDGDAIDSSKWSHEVNCNGGGNAEQQCYTDDAANSFVADGILNIVAKPAAAPAEGEDPSPLPYTSARLNTKDTQSWKYGRFEIRAKLPAGQGAWPAFWMLPTDEAYGGWPKSGEIDIVETVNLKASTNTDLPESHIHGTLHYGAGPEDDKRKQSGKGQLLPNNANPADDFHTYAVEWEEGEIRWYVDGFNYATQRESKKLYNSAGELLGLTHRGWFTEVYSIATGELETQWTTAPFDQEFHLLLNFAVGGQWPSGANDKGIDASAFANGNAFQVDYVRVYECQQDPETGKGCAIVRPGYDTLEETLVLGEAPLPVPPSSGIAKNLTIFAGTLNPNWPAWDCCGGSTPAVVADADKGNVVEFSVGAEPTVNGFITREAFIDPDGEGQVKPFDASPLLSKNGRVQFDMKVTTAPNNSTAAWFFKVESAEGDTAAEMPITNSSEGLAPTIGVWQTYTFPLQVLADAGLELGNIDVVMIFPAWGEGEGAVYQVTNLVIEGDLDLTVFEDEVNPSWPMWDCCGGSTPTVETDDDAHGAVAQFTIGGEPTVVGFISRAANIPEGSDAEPAPFDATGMLSNGVVQFDLKPTAMPANSDSTWMFKIESNGGDTNAELALTTSVEGVSPTLDQWQTYTFNLSDLAQAGLDVSALDVIMVYPAWGTGDGAIYRLDNVKIYEPTPPSEEE